MQNSENNNFLQPRLNSKIFVDYRPAELHVNTQWLIVYYAKNPATLAFQRFRVIVPAIKDKKERLIHAKTMTTEINVKLRSGWLSFYDDLKSTDFKTFDYCCAEFLKQIASEVKRGEKRSDTLKSYTSNINLILDYRNKKKIKLKLMLDLTLPVVVNYLDWTFFDRKNSALTYNNRITFLNLFMNFCVAHGWQKINFMQNISRKRKATKKRKVLTPEVKQKLKDFGLVNTNYYCLCMLTYFCFIRRTEATKLKVCDVNMKENYIYIDESIAKNRKSENVTISLQFSAILSKQIAAAKSSDYLFSANDFKTGSKMLVPKKISDHWLKFRKVKTVSTEFDFYSLKNTGITDLLSSGIPTIKVRNQARQYDLKITESYTARNNASDDAVRNSNFDF